MAENTWMEGVKKGGGDYHQINLQAYWVIFGVSIGKIEFKNLISWSFWARIEGHA